MVINRENLGTKLSYLMLLLHIRTIIGGAKISK